MRLTEQQRRARASRVALARSVAELGLNSAKDEAEYIRMDPGNYSRARKNGFVPKGLARFCFMANKLSFTDDEILRIVRAKE